MFEAGVIQKMGINHWDKSPDGNLVCFPLTGCETAPMLNGMVALIRFEYLLDQHATDRAALQLAITTTEVTRLISELQTLQQQLQDNLATDRPKGKSS